MTQLIFQKPLVSSALLSLMASIIWSVQNSANMYYTFSSLHSQALSLAHLPLKWGECSTASVHSAITQDLPAPDLSHQDALHKGNITQHSS